MVDKFVKEIYSFTKDYTEYQFNDYENILQKHGLEWGIDSMATADVSKVVE